MVKLKKGDTMNETIGVKGGHNDRRRTIKIKEKAKKKLLQEIEDREIKELEARVKKQQRFILIKTLPIVLVGQTFKTLFDVAHDEKKTDKEDVNSKWRVKKYGVDYVVESSQERKRREKVVIDDTGRKIVVEVSDLDHKKKNDILDDINVISKRLIKEEELAEAKENERVKKKEEEKEAVEAKKKKEEQQTQETNLSDENIIDYGFGPATTATLVAGMTPAFQEKLSKLKARKIIDEYEKQLKDVRYDLRQLIFEYNVLVEEADEAIVSKEAEIILDKLTDIINRVEVLKRKIKVEDLDKYDDNYIYTLIEGYLEEFKDQRLVAEIKDSPLYILISEKLTELDTKKDILSGKVEKKKERLEIKEEKFDKLKEKYFNIDRINKELLAFQHEQELLLKEVKEKVKNATTVQEKAEIEVEAMNRQSRKLLGLLTLSMLFPGSRAGRSMATTTAAYLYFVNNLLRPKTTTKKYKVVTVKDYSRDIEKSLESFDDAFDLLSKTSVQVDKMITQISEEFKEYLGVIPEVAELLSNLQKVRDEIHEKEYEMEKMKKEQERVLEKNNAKVKTMGKYPM